MESQLGFAPNVWGFWSTDLRLPKWSELVVRHFEGEKSLRHPSAKSRFIARSNAPVA
jgi:hypothetical protein